MIKAATSLILLTALGLDYLNNITKKENVDKRLKFNENGEFTILQFTDLHYGESDEKDKNNLNI